MWMCAAMPRPDMDSGSVAFNLDLGAVIALNQYRSSASKKDLIAIVEKEVALQNAMKNSKTCNALPEFNRYYPQKDKAVFTYAPVDVDTIQCEYSVEIAQERIKHLFIDNKVFVH
jgi:hypothetical protein